MTVYEAAVASFITVPSLYHWYEVPPVAVNTVLLPGQMVAVAGLIDPVGALVTVMEALLDDLTLQLPLIMSAVYVPDSLAEYVEEVAPGISTLFIYQR